MMGLSTKKLSLAFVAISLVLLSLTVLFGLLAAMQYVFPGWGRDEFSFEKLRPLHVSSAVFWILTGAMGCVLSFVEEHRGRPLRFPGLLKIQFLIFALTLPAIFVSYFLGIFSGREYWEFHPYFAIPIIIGWILFLFNLIGSAGGLRRQPVYVWMWMTGGCFFLFTYLESNLWIFPWFQHQINFDMTIQWKSYGSLVGGWNMLIYGSSIFLMDKISGNQKASRSNIAFYLYFLGLFNGMFNWGHHIYTLPTHTYIKVIAYSVSMTELILLARIIYLWRDTLTDFQKYSYRLPYRFVLAADIWVFITLCLAIPMSIPAINIYMHGTFVVVGHTMGATIGINSMLLLAFIHYLVLENNADNSFSNLTRWGFILVQIALPVFFLSLLTAGFFKGFWQMNPEQMPFASMMYSLRPWFFVFFFSGIGLFIGFLMLIFPLLVKVLTNFALRTPKLEGAYSLNKK